MNKAESVFVAVNRWALIFLLAAMSVIVFTNVVLRYLTNHSITWSEEAARYLMIWMTFLGAGLVLRFGGHVAIESLHHVLPSRAGQILRGILVLITLAFFVAMAWQGTRYAIAAQYQTTPALGLSFIYIYSVFPIGFLLLIVHLLLVARRFVLCNRFVDSDEVSAETTAAL